MRNRMVPVVATEDMWWSDDLDAYVVEVKYSTSDIGNVYWNEKKNGYILIDNGI